MAKYLVYGKAKYTNGKTIDIPIKPAIIFGNDYFKADSPEEAIKLGIKRLTITLSEILINDAGKPDDEHSEFIILNNGKPWVTITDFFAVEKEKSKKKKFII